MESVSFVGGLTPTKRDSQHSGFIAGIVISVVVALGLLTALVVVLVQTSEDVDTIAKRGNTAAFMRSVKGRKSRMAMVDPRSEESQQGIGAGPILQNGMIVPPVPMPEQSVPPAAASRQVAEMLTRDIDAQPPAGADDERDSGAEMFDRVNALTKGALTMSTDLFAAASPSGEIIQRNAFGDVIPTLAGLKYMRDNAGVGRSARMTPDIAGFQGRNRVGQYANLGLGNGRDLSEVQDRLMPRLQSTVYQMLGNLDGGDADQLGGLMPANVPLSAI